ncbi:MAG: diguanylate cyclase [Motiliproteus sp.]
MPISESEQIIRTLHKITTDYQLGFDHQVKLLLELGCQRFDLDIGILSRITVTDYVVDHCVSPAGFDLTPGTCFDLNDTYCALTLAQKGPLGFEHAGRSEAAKHPAYKKFSLKSYIGVPIFLNNQIYGTLNFSSLSPRKRKFKDADIDALQLMATWIGTEISRRQKETALWNAEERFQLAIEASPSAMLMVNPLGTIVNANKAAETLFGYPPTGMINQRVEILLPEDARKQHPQLREIFSNKPKSRAMGAGKDLLAKRSDGSSFPVSVGLNPIDTPEGELILVSVVDHTERKKFEDKICDQSNALKKANEEIYLQATTDSLTGLANRRSLFTHLKTLLQLTNRGNRCLSLLLLDLDLFKQYNDTYGHVAGDDALKQVSQTLLEAARASDLVARYGGEEFAIILPETDKTGAITIGQRILSSISTLDSLETSLTVSIGAATLEFESEREMDALVTSMNLIEVADQSLYQSKAQGRNLLTHYDNYIHRSQKKLFVT